MGNNNNKLIVEYKTPTNMRFNWDIIQEAEKLEQLGKPKEIIHLPKYQNEQLARNIANILGFVKWRKKMRNQPKQDAFNIHKSLCVQCT